MDAKGTTGRPDDVGFVPDRTRRGVELPDLGSWNTGQYVILRWLEVRVA